MVKHAFAKFATDFERISGLKFVSNGNQSPTFQMPDSTSTTHTNNKRKRQIHDSEISPIDDNYSTSSKENVDLLKKEIAELQQKLAESNRLQNYFASESAKKSKEIEDLKMKLDFKTVESNQKSKYLSQIFNDIVSHSSKYQKE